MRALGDPRDQVSSAGPGGLRTPTGGAVEPRDCPECGATGSVFTTFCEVCTNEFSEGAADLPPAAPDAGRGAFRMDDVVAEIRTIGDIAASSATPQELRQACKRAEQLIRGLRRQFRVRRRSGPSNAYVVARDLIE